MKKNVSICFRTSAAIRDALSNIAEEERKSVSSVIESIIYQHLKTGIAIDGIGKERRRFLRKKVSLPAFIDAADSRKREFEAGTVLDISMGGIRFSVPKGTKFEAQNGSNDSEFSVLFILPEESKPVRIKCRTMQIYDESQVLQIGAAFMDADFNSYRALHNYLQ
jgi:hypothetical protein